MKEMDLGILDSIKKLLSCELQNHRKIQHSRMLLILGIASSSHLINNVRYAVTGKVLGVAFVYIPSARVRVDCHVDYLYNCKLVW
jgi:hypothetical protein